MKVDGDRRGGSISREVEERMVDPFRLRWACGSPLLATGAGGLNKFSASREASRGVLEDEAWPLAVPLVVWDILGGTGDLFTVDGFVICGQEVDCAGVSSLTMTVRRTMGRGGDPDDGWDEPRFRPGFYTFRGSRSEKPLPGDVAPPCCCSFVVFQ